MTSLAHYGNHDRRASRRTPPHIPYSGRMIDQEVHSEAARRAYKILSEMRHSPDGYK